MLIQGIMSDISRITMKFERLMGHSHDELMEMGRHPTPRMDPSEMKTIGYVTYNSKTGQYEYTPKRKYSKKTNTK